MKTRKTGEKLSFPQLTTEHSGQLKDKRGNTEQPWSCFPAIGILIFITNQFSYQVKTSRFKDRRPPLETLRQLTISI